MNSSSNFAVLAVALVFSAAFIAPAAEPQGKLLFFGVAYDEAPGPRRTIAHYDYAPDNFTRLLQSQSSGLFAEIKAGTVKGAFATKETIAAGLKALPAMVHKNDLVVLY